MRVQLNRKTIEFTGNTILELLRLVFKREKLDFLVVVVNRNIILKSRWRFHVLNENDAIFVVMPAEGG